VRIAYATQLVGVLETNVTFPLERVDGRWGIVFAPALIWPDLVNGQQLLMIPFVPDRGIIYDRNGVPMVELTDAVAIGVIPGEVTPEDNTLANGLGRLFGTSGQSIAALWANATPLEYVPIGEVSAAAYAQYSWLGGVAGIRVNPYTARFYHGNGAAAHVTGYTSFLTPEELPLYLAQGYSADQRLGRTSLERWGESMLAGVNGGQLTLLDAAGNPLRALTIVQPQFPQDLYTTVDYDLQRAVSFALGGYTGAAVVLNMATGEVLALASSPTFDPNRYEPNNLNRQFTSAEAFSTGLVNNAAQDAYPAGSIFKLVTFSAGLTSSLFTPESEYTCTGVFTEVQGFSATDWLEGGHGAITLSEGLSGSCNPYFWHLGKTLFDWNPDWLSQTARAFGLGAPTGVAQFDETPGLIPDPQWKLQNQGQAWEVIDSLNTAVGQGNVLVTPLQIARLVAAIGNGGTLHQPQLVLRLQAPEGPPTQEFAPIAVGQLPLDEAQLAALQTAMHNVTQPPLGTARNRFRGFRIPIYGKTGTAETAAPEPHAWFAGYTLAQQADRPDIAIAVWVSNIGQGSDIAAPIFRRIVESYFDLPLTRYPWEESIGVVATPEPTATPEGTPAAP
jgi:penicillin-binding protein 2